MEMAFSNLMYKFVLVYLDDITIYSKKVTDHINHLKQIFGCCKEFGISLNLKKCILSVHEGKLLGYIVSKKGITMDPECIAAILELPLPQHEKGLQSFIGHINFVRRFFPDIAALLKPLIAMLKKNTVFAWTKEAKEKFQAIKDALAITPVSINPNFGKDFILYAYGGFDVISAMLVQKNLEGLEQPITFFSKGLGDFEQRCNFFEKHVLSIVKSLKKFRHLLTHNKMILRVAHPSVK